MASLTTLLQMQSRLCFCAPCELQLGSSAGMRVLERKKGSRITRLPCLKRTWLEVEFHNKLHGTSIVSKGLCRIIEGAVPGPYELSDAG